MATAKSSGSTRLGRDSRSKRLGVKLFAGETAKPGDIIIRQRGTKFIAGQNVKMGGDNTLYSMANGYIKFSSRRLKKFNGATKVSKVVNVLTVAK
ncbi:50S ribosomal protein L27 [Candidatus Azambacteria bacterium]|nr:50S ribosomal protein L27 [Candidatus Azambacteria bacterium]